MTAAPKHEHFVWTGCVNATPAGKDKDGNPHFPCRDCHWAADVDAAKSAKTK